jgi:dolichol-phosphate mannosyltransferase
MGLGSRYRRLISQGVRWFARILFHERLWTLQDPGSGFFIVRSELLRQKPLRPIGYKILVEILMRSSWSRLEEVPYSFEVRAGGDSKATFKQGLLFLRHAARIFVESPTSGRFWKFLIIGGVGTVVNLSLLWLLGLQLGLPHLLSWLVALEASLFSNCLFNRTLTWRDRRSSGWRGLLSDGARYHGAMAAGLLASTAVFTALTLLSTPLLFAGLGGIATGGAINFLGCDNFVFHRSRTRAPSREITQA